jgi:hypothetical protein
MLRLGMEQIANSGRLSGPPNACGICWPRQPRGWEACASPSLYTDYEISPALDCFGREARYDVGGPQCGTSTGAVSNSIQIQYVPRREGDHVTCQCHSFAPLEIWQSEDFALAVPTLAICSLATRHRATRLSTELLRPNIECLGLAMQTQKVQHSFVLEAITSFADISVVQKKGNSIN